jgi:hypothetical protein
VVEVEAAPATTATATTTVVATATGDDGGSDALAEQRPKTPKKAYIRLVSQDKNGGRSVFKFRLPFWV